MTYVQSAHVCPGISRASQRGRFVHQWCIHSTTRDIAGPREHAKDSWDAENGLDVKEPTHVTWVDIVEGQANEEINNVRCFGQLENFDRSGITIPVIIWVVIAADSGNRFGTLLKDGQIATITALTHCAPV